MSNYILVVDDNPTDLLITKTLVEKENFLSVTASNGIEALDVLEEFEFSLFIVDLLMPKMGGIEFIQRIRRMEKFKKTPVIVTSARNEARDIKLSITAGVNDYLVKPIDAQIFEEKLHKQVGQKQVWKEYTVVPGTDLENIYVKNSTRLISLSEIGGTLASKTELVEGQLLELSGSAFSKELSDTINAQVDKVVHKDGVYQAKVTFVGLTEECRKTIRLNCRKIWMKSLNPDDESKGGTA